MNNQLNKHTSQAPFSSLVKSISLGIVVFGLVWACQPPPELPIIPRISYNRMEFYPQGGNASDSLILYINFEDGDGDIGLRSTDDQYPYQPYNFIIDADRKLVTYGGKNFKLPFYSIPLDRNGRPARNETFFSDTDTRGPFNCQQYEIIELCNNNDCSTTRVDTVFIEKNINNKNIYVDFYRKVNGQYRFLDWTNAFRTDGCGVDFHARFPIFDNDNLGKSLTGTLRYAMLSEGFGIILKKDTFKVQVYIKDRALHDSNVVESPDLTLDNITAN